MNYFPHAPSYPYEMDRSMESYQTMPDLPSLLMQELYQQILPLESFGLPGVQTTTTPTLTLTPTTMRSFAADLLNGALDDEQTPYHNEAGFVPPIVHPASTYVVDSKSWQGGSVTTMLAASVVSAVSTSGSTATTATVASNAVPVAVSTAASTIPTLAVSPPLPSPTPAPSRKNTGGRRPNKSNGISPEEEERRQMRRDRNKAAAARCRKRRLDQTMTLEKETSILESKKMFLQSEIQELTNEVKELEYLLETHVCCLPRSDRCASPLDIKPAIYDLKQEQELKQQQESIELREPPMKRPMMSVPPPPLAPPVQSKPNRPTTLPVSSHSIFRSTASEIAGISITTPSTVIGLNFESLMDGGTGLTPVSGPLVPSCSSQQRNHNGVDLGSPDSNITNKLVSL